MAVIILDGRPLIEIVNRFSNTLVSFTPQPIIESAFTLFAINNLSEFQSTVKMYSSPREQNLTFVVEDALKVLTNDDNLLKIQGCVFKMVATIVHVVYMELERLLQGVVETYAQPDEWTYSRIRLIEWRGTSIWFEV